MLGKVRTNDAYGAYCLPKSMGDKSVNRLRAITQTSRAGSTEVSGQLRVKQCEDTFKSEKSDWTKTHAWSINTGHDWF